MFLAINNVHILNKDFLFQQLANSYLFLFTFFQESSYSSTSKTNY